MKFHILKFQITSLRSEVHACHDEFFVVNIFQLPQGYTTQLCNDWVSIICLKFRPRAEPRVACIEHRDFRRSSRLRTKGVYQEEICHPNSSGLVHTVVLGQSLGNFSRKLRARGEISSRSQIM